jgi:hypothetical protein
MVNIKNLQPKKNSQISVTFVDSYPGKFLSKFFPPQESSGAVTEMHIRSITVIYSPRDLANKMFSEGRKDDICVNLGT